MQQQIWGEVVDFNLAFFQFIWECNSENIIKIGPYLPELLQEKFGAVFFGPPCMVKTGSLYLTWAWFGTGSWHQDGQTDRQTDRITIANMRSAVPAGAGTAVARKKRL